MYNRETLLKALAEIVKVCKEFEDCYCCPMCSDDGRTCLIKSRFPTNWELTDTTTPWRAFK